MRKRKKLARRFLRYCNHYPDNQTLLAFSIWWPPRQADQHRRALKTMSRAARDGFPTRP